MPIPRFTLTAIAAKAPKTFEAASELTYLDSVAINVNAVKDHRLALYIRYFKAEQEERGSEMAAVLKDVELLKDKESYRQVFELIEGRRLLLERSTTVEQIKSWLARCGGLFPQSLTGYIHFLAGTAFFHADALELSAQQMAQSASAFHSVNQPSRELQSVLQSPDQTSSEVRYLRSYALRAGDIKSYHLAGFMLARLAGRSGDGETARRFARKSILAFREEFLDPRRVRLSQELFQDSWTHDRDLTKMETLLLKKLELGPSTKGQLIAELYGSAVKYASRQSIDSRFRTLLSRLNKKLKGQIAIIDGLYRLTRD